MKISIQIAIVSLLSLSALGQTPLNESQKAQSAAAFWLTEGVLVDPVSSAIYTINPEDGIHAISTSGALLWSQGDSARPIGVYGDWLIAQKVTDNANLEMVKVNREDGSLVGNPFQIGLPAPTRTLVAARLGETFHIQSQFINDKLYSSWEHRKRQVGGMPPADGIIPETKSEGALSFDFVGDGAAVTPVANVPQDPTRVAPQSVQDWLAQNRSEIPLARGSSVFAATFVRTSGTSREVVLQRWEASTGNAMAEVVLTNQPHLIQFLSADERHVMVTSRVAPGQFLEYQWQIFDIENGDSVGTVRDHFSMGHFFVADDHVIVTTVPYSRMESGVLVEYPTRLRAIRLNASTQSWDQTIRDLHYTGPVPP